MIKDLISLVEFFEELATAHPDVAYFLPLSNGEKAVDEISAYYTDDYAGLTAFFQAAEIGHSDDLMTFHCSLTVAAKPADNRPRSILETRDQTMKILLKLLGDLTLKADEAIREIEEMGESTPGESYDLIIAADDRLFPIAMLANVDLEGYYVDIDVTVPVNHLMFPA